MAKPIESVTITLPCFSTDWPSEKKAALRDAVISLMVNMQPVALHNYVNHEEWFLVKEIAEAAEQAVAEDLI